MRRVSTLLMCTTLLSSAAVPTVLHAAETVQKPDLQSVKASLARLASSADQSGRLTDEVLKREPVRIAQAYDSSYRAPDIWDAAAQHGSRFTPSVLREVGAATDPGILTSGQRMMLAPNPVQPSAQRDAATGPGGDTASGSVFRANHSSAAVVAALPSPTAQTWNLFQIWAYSAYARNFTGAGVNVMVVDSGVDLTNEALKNRLRLDLAAGYYIQTKGSFVPSDVGIVSPSDSHGTHVSGIVAAEKFGNVAMHGVAYNASVVPLTLSDTGPNATTSVELLSASRLNYFATLPNVMIYNASYGPPLAKDAPPQSVWTIAKETPVEEAAALKALKAGKIIVGAAGNDRERHPAARNPSGLPLMPFLSPAHRDLGVYDDLGAGYDFTELQRQPGQIISVVATGDTKQIAYYSNYCGYTASWCVAAPGGDADVGQEVYSAVNGNKYGFMQGTSMAAPTVSGALAVLIEANPTYNAQDLSRLLFSTTEDLGKAGIDDVYGHGLIRLDRATDGETTLAANATKSVAANTTEYWSRLLNTQGSFTKDGEGILTISGRTNANGSVFAQRGTLAVDGTLTVSAGSKLNVGQPATLAGFGAVVGDSSIAGTLSPGKMANIDDLLTNGSILPGTVLQGNSAGSLTFNGKVSLTSTANTRIDIDGTLLIPGGPGTYDKIYVTGAGNVFYAGGTLTPVLRGSVGTVSNYTPAIGTQMAFVQAQNGAATAGSFSTVVQPTSGLPTNGRFDLIYGTTALTLAVTPASFSALANADRLGDSQKFFAAILDEKRVAPGVVPMAAEKALFDAVYKLNSEAEFDKALSQLGGPGQPAVAGASLQAFAGFLGAIGDRQDALAFGSDAGQNGTAQNIALSYAGRNLMTAETNPAMSAFASMTPSQRVQDGWTMWGQGFGRTSRVGDSGDLSGSKATSAGFTLGADRWFSNNLIAGGAFGYARTSATSTDMQGNSDTYAGAAYASWTPGAAVFDVRMAAGPSQMSTTRQIILASNGLQGSANGVGVGTSFEAGYRFAIAPDVILKPYAGINWQGFRRDGYSENNLPIGLVYSAQFYDKLMTSVGAAVSAKLRTADGTTLAPEVKLGWGHDLRDTTLVSQAALLDQSFLVNAAAPGRNAALVGAKLSGWRTETFRLFGAYNGEYRSNATSHQLSAGARFNW